MDKPNDGYRVTETIRGAHPQSPTYPLLLDDLLVKNSDGTWTKEAPGLCVVGFILTPEQEATLSRARFRRAGLQYEVEAD